ncbi:unnamed protein product [Moneuplotes crassus]|uniref:Uncharacterized protein n=1 Tax=Euplotes crassus TaxID=5936 RepID=A0AAD1XB94_EUPCR|nr:unnamed protein product [Moneuplotes crassus]
MIAFGIIRKQIRKRRMRIQAENMVHNAAQPVNNQQNVQQIFQDPNAQQIYHNPNDRNQAYMITPNDSVTPPPIVFYETNMVRDVQPQVYELAPPNPPVQPMTESPMMAPPSSPVQVRGSHIVPVGPGVPI